MTGRPDRRRELAGRTHRRHRSSSYRPPGRLRGPGRPSRLSSAEVPWSRYARLPRWYSREHFLEVALPLAVRMRPECLQAVRGGNLTLDTFLAVMRVEAEAANHDGTQLIAAVDDIADRLGCSPTTVQRARAAARRLGVYRTLLWGRYCTHTERLEQGGGRYVPGAWPRRLANESVFVLPRWLAVALRRAERRSPAQTSRSGDHGAPPNGCRTAPENHIGNQLLLPHSRSAIEAASPPALRSQAGLAPNGLARAMAARDGPVPWLRGTSAARVTPALRTYVAHGWTPRDLARALAAVDPARWDRPSREVRYPAALLAWFLRRIDPAADRPSLLDQIEADQRRDERRRDHLDHAARQATASGATPAWHQARQQLGL
ncbi:MAG: hypothetical protein ACRDMV_24910 [Streptosporangiales bacterium]